VHIRTMDWGMDFLKPLTIQVEFQHGGVTMFTCTTWAGYVGILTGMKPHGWSASVNFRSTSDGSFWTNFKKTLSRSWPVGFLLRELFEKGVTYDEAVESLATWPVIAPCYFTLAGRRAGDGALITRLPDAEEQRWTLHEQGFIVQTNIDHWSTNEEEDIMDSIERREFARAFIKTQQVFEGENYEKLWQLMSQDPILNELTIYATLMCPATATFATRIPDARSGFLRKGNPGIYRVDTAKQRNEAKMQRRCSLCWKLFTKDGNLRGQCGHSGDWHSKFDDCTVLKCGLGLASNIGKQHWSCCYSVSEDGPCKKSGFHEE